MMTWLKPEVLISIFVGLCTIAGTALVTWSNGNVHSALIDATLARLESRLATIEAQTIGVPLYVQRLTQLEDQRKDQLAYNGAVDSRLYAVESKASRTADQMLDIKNASSVPLRK